jgi:hypothetical protein
MNEIADKLTELLANRPSMYSSPEAKFDFWNEFISLLDQFREYTSDTDIEA